MITFDTIGLEYDLCDIGLLEQEQVKRKLESFKKYGRTTLFFDDLPSSIKVLFDDIPCVDDLHYPGVKVQKQGDIKVYRDSFGNSRKEKPMYMYFAPTPSYSYNLNIRKVNNLIRCEFSIPKFLYGHNLNLFPNVQSIENMQKDKYFGSLYRSEVRHLQGDLFKGFYTIPDLQSLYCLKKFVHDFTYEIFDCSSLSFSPELYRLDLSYNYKFSTPNSFDYYTGILKDFFRKKHNGRYTNYNDETFSKVTKQYSVKLYNKEAEFKTHDYDEIKKFFGESRLKLSEDEAERRASGLLAFSQSVMRAEISLRKTELKQLFFNNYDKFDFAQKTLYRFNLPNYRKVVNVMRSLNLFKSWIQVEYLYQRPQLDGRYYPVAPRCKMNLSERQLNSVRIFWQKYSNVLCKDLQDKIKDVNDDYAIYNFLDSILSVVVGCGDSTTVNLKLFSPIFRTSFNVIREIEREWKFYINKTAFSKKHFCVNSTLLSLGWSKLKSYVNTFKNVEIDYDHVIKFLRNNRKKIKNDLHYNVTPIIAFCGCLKVPADTMYYGYSKTSYYRLQEKLDTIVKYYELPTRPNDYESFDFDVEYENTDLTTIIPDINKRVRENYLERTSLLTALEKRQKEENELYNNDIYESNVQE